MCQIRGIAAMGSDYALQLLVSLFRTADSCHVSNAIFQMSPSDTDEDELPSLAGCKSEVVSGWVLDLLLKIFE